MTATPPTLPDGYYVKGSTLFSTERCVRVLSNKERDLGPRSICSWNGDGCPPGLLEEVARLDKQSRKSLNASARRHALRELAALFRGLASIFGS